MFYLICYWNILKHFNRVLRCYINTQGTYMYLLTNMFKYLLYYFLIIEYYLLINCIYCLCLSTFINNEFYCCNLQWQNKLRNIYIIEILNFDLNSKLLFTSFDELLLYLLFYSYLSNTKLPKLLEIKTHNIYFFYYWH